MHGHASADFYPFDLAVSGWSSIPRNTLDNIQKVEDIQRNFTRRFAGLQNLNYRQRLSKLKLLSLQRRRERYMIIHVWKISSQNAPNDINMEFRQNSRLGIRVKIPLWNILPKEITVVKQLEQLKILLNKFLHKYPDQPPTKWYTASNRNSLIDWNLQSGGPQLARWPC